MVAGHHPSMSDYERKAWETLLDDIANRSTEQGKFGRLASTAKGQAKGVALKAKNSIVDKVPVAEKAFFDAVDDSLQKAMIGLHTAFVERGLNSVSAGAIFETFASEGADVSSYDSIRELDLRVCDRSVPRRKEKYIALAAGQGAATSLAVTGATVSSTVSGGTTLGVAAGAIAVDVTAVMVGMGRIVALVAAHYGYDVREPEEQMFAAGVLSYSSAGSAAEKGGVIGCALPTDPRYDASSDVETVAAAPIGERDPDGRHVAGLQLDEEKSLPRQCPSPAQ